jgi:TPP-dependent 2-oxoacid decarboxylase
MSTHYTRIGRYLLERLHQAGIAHMFGLPGDIR